MSRNTWMAGLVVSAVLTLWVGAAAVDRVSWASARARSVPRADAIPQRLAVVDRHGELLDEFGRHRRYVHVDDLPAYVPDAFIAAEDGWFRWHTGVDPVAVVRAAVQNARAGTVTQGGSTITQQVVKNTVVGDRRSLRRKWDEALVAAALERQATKQEILDLYLNLVYLGDGAYGVDEAARHLFGVSATELTLAQTAVLATLVPAPSVRSPRHDPRAALERRNALLDDMEDAGSITAEQARSARDEPLRIEVRRSPELANHGAAFRTELRRQLRALDPQGGLRSLGATVHTTLDLGLQRVAEQAVQDAVEAVHTRQDNPLEDGRPPVQGAAVVMHTESGEIRALVGGTDDTLEGLVRATQSRRQPGSAFKPLVYAAALQQGRSQVDVEQDLPLSLPSGSGRWWSPGNYGGTYRGPMTLRTALAVSSNVVAVRTGADTGVQAILDTARSLGVHSPLAPDLTVVLGASGVTPLEMTTAYGSIARGGQYLPPSWISAVTDESGTIYVPGDTIEVGARRVELPNPRPRRVLDPGVASELVDMMASVVERGTGRHAYRQGQERIGKTGTTNDSRDAWFVGATPTHTIAVWIGRDDNGSLGDRETGGRTALPAWATIADAASPVAPDETQTFAVSPQARWEQMWNGERIIVARGRQAEDALANLQPLARP